jgi:hypothetical protein
MLHVSTYPVKTLCAGCAEILGCSPKSPDVS